MFCSALPSRLTVAFVVMKPHADVGAGIDRLRPQAIAAGQKIIVERSLPNA